MPNIQEIPFLTVVHPDTTFPHYFLIISMKCKHCLTVVANLGANYPLPFNWSLCALTTKSEETEMLSAVVESARKGGNPFFEFFSFAQGTKGWPRTDVQDSIRVAIKKTRSYFQGMDYTGIPILIVQESEKQFRSFQGEKIILDYLDSRGILEKKAILVKDKDRTNIIPDK
jgi:hypothetical protein